jgi:hypothetical protein
MHNTFTYRHSDLPPFRPEIKAEIVALGLHADDLILKSQGNYRELEELAETLDNCLDSCNLNLQSIRIIADSSPQPANTMTNLPIGEQAAIFATALFNEALLSALRKRTDIKVDSLVALTSSQVKIRMAKFSDEQITECLGSLLSEHSTLLECRPNK